MRTAFITELLRSARAGDDVWLVTGDLGYSVLEPFAIEFPERYVNAGVAEQSMIGLAAGIAREGAVVFAYSIANFPTFRALEQVRNDVAYPGIPVVIVSVGSGFSYGSHGSTHHAVEDVAVMRSMPGMRVISPGDPTETSMAVQALIRDPGPSYLRLGKAGERSIPSEIDADFRLGVPRLIRDGADVTIIATGSILASASDAVVRLAEYGVNAALFSAHSLRPFDATPILERVRAGTPVVTVEEHRAIGGLRSAVAEALLDAGLPTGRVAALAIPAELRVGTGSQSALRQVAGLSADDIVATAQALVGSR